MAAGNAAQALSLAVTLAESILAADACATLLRIVPLKLACYVMSMGDHCDLTDPNVEPTDDALDGLIRRAFDDVRAAEIERKANLRAAILREREALLRARRAR